MSKKGSQSALSEDQVDEFKDIFEMFDVSRTGSITKDDLKQVCSQFGVRLASEDLDSMFKECDVLGKGKIAFPEFMSMMAKKMQQASSEVQLQRAFKAFDLDDDGKIPTSYLTEKLTTQGDKLSRKEVPPQPNLPQMQALCDIAENDKQEIVYSMFIDTMFAKNKQAS